MEDLSRAIRKICSVKSDKAVFRRLDVLLGSLLVTAVHQRDVLRGKLTRGMRDGGTEPTARKYRRRFDPHGIDEKSLKCFSVVLQLKRNLEDDSLVSASEEGVERVRKWRISNRCPGSEQKKKRG